MAPRRIAALAVCLLALAAGAAAVDCNSLAGSFEMQLVEASGSGTTPLPADHEVPTCLTSVKVTIEGTGCKVALESAAAGSVFVTALWASQTNYRQLQECPATSADAAKGAAATADAAGVTAALLDSIKNFVYGGNKNSMTGTPVIDIINGVVTVKSSSTSTPVYQFVYAITQSTLTAATFAGAQPVSSASTLIAAATKTPIGDKCGSGRYGIVVSSETTGDEVQICPMCPAGTTGNGDGCTACAAGSASSSVGASSCSTSCTAGTYAQAGSSACLPCPTGTYQDGTSQAECKECPNDSYAWIPGSTGCLRCIKGVPACVAGAITGFTCAANGNAGSPGYHVLNFVTDYDPSKCTALSTSYAIKPYDQCASWKAAPVAGTSAALQLSLFVEGDCSVTISPISDKTCSDPGANTTTAALNPWTASTNGVDASGNYAYTYNDLLLQGYYTTPKAIRSLLPSTDSGATSSMLGIDFDTVASVNIKFWAATNKAADATTLLGKTGGDASCTVNARTAGGQVFEGITAVTETSCPAGSYGVDNQYCLPCPQGYTCAGGKAKAACAADTANPYLGAGTSYCTNCKAATGDSPRTRPTSYAGAGYCTVPYLERNCPTAGTYWDESAAKCLDCPAGTYRAAGDAANLECRACPAGQYSGPRAGTCTDCPAGQYSPSTGLADQTAISGTKCLRCPKGSIALADTEAINTAANIEASDYRNKKALSPKAISCDACPSGTYHDTTDHTVGCTPCPHRTYRTGDASPLNNECKNIPAGYKAKTLLAPVAAPVNPGGLQCLADGSSTTTCVGAYEIEACAVGTVSSWSGTTTRSPAEPMKCTVCTSNTYAPRTGMAACIACPGGTKPDKSSGSLLGPNTCTACAAGDYRSILKAQATCDACNAAGFEAGPSGRTGCTQCRPGYYKGTYSALWTDSEKDNCQPCPQNSFMARPGASVCDVCPRGFETQDTGNTQCDPCAVGYYKRLAGATSCIAAEIGTFVNTSAAYFTTPCPLGTFNDKTAQDSCDPCPPGQYANAQGSTACKTCPAGTFSAGQASTCKSCEAGYFAVAGSGGCSPCKPGTYTNKVRTGTCALCPKGTQCPTPATKTPRACPAGTFASKEGSTVCTPCPVNFISTTTGRTQCTACPSGSNTRGLTGQTRCQAVRVSGLRRSVL